MASAAANNPIVFAENGLYILLSDMANSNLQFHWGLYLAKSPEHGEIFHMVNNISTNYEWKYQTRQTPGVKGSRTLRSALKIGVVDPALHESMAQCLATVSTSPPITCRVWLERALYDLGEGGYVKLMAPVDCIQDEAAELAMQNAVRGQKTVEASRLSRR